MRKGTILFVEDDLSLINALKYRYEGDYRVLTAMNVEEAVAVFNKNRGNIGLMVVDLYMPLELDGSINEKAGLIFVKKIRSLEAEDNVSHTTVIILTGHDDAQDMRDQLEEASLWLVKGVEGWLERLDINICEVLSQRIY